MDDRVSTITSLSGGGTDTRHFVYAPDGRVLGEYGSSAGDVKAEFIWMHPQVGESSMFGGDDGLGGYMPLAVAVPTATAGITELNWAHGNHMGVPIYYSDASGAQLATPTGYTVPGFPGQSRTFTDLYYNRYRDYDSSTGRYVQADPIGLNGDVNPYLYALGNPLRYSDPTGEFAIVIPIAISVGEAALACWINPLCRAGVVLLATWPFWDDCIEVMAGLSSTPNIGLSPTFDLPPILYNKKPPSDAHDPNGAKAPGKPGPETGFKDPKSGEKWGKALNGQEGWLDDKGNVWVPTGQGGLAHGRGGGLAGAHWDVQGRRGGSLGNRYPGGYHRPH
jgi:RHS repeat-associated protein